MALYKIIIICKGFYPRRKSPGTHWIGGWVGPRTGLEFVEKRNILPLPGIQPHLSTPMPVETPISSKQASSGLLLAFASMVILGVEPHQDP
jgi:hypothetical protein